MKPGTRAVLRLIKGAPNMDWPTCVHCGDFIKFEAPRTLEARVRRGEPAHTKQVICNIYELGRWVRVDHYHESCFDDAGRPVSPFHTDDIKWERGARDDVS
jgi:hypothetical protein